MKTETKQNKLTEDEQAQLLQWVSATPLQRLEWLEEAQKIAYQSGAWQKQAEAKNKT